MARRRMFKISRLTDMAGEKTIGVVRTNLFFGGGKSLTRFRDIKIKRK